MSKSHALMQVDAFADYPLGGNPCAVVFDADDLDTETMQAIALEMNLSETAFVLTSDVADYRVRYFTPAEEIPMAGHPTIATTYALVASGRQALHGDKTSITLEMNVGPIGVEIQSKQGRIERIVMTQKKPQFLKVHNPDEVLPIFGVTSDDWLSDYPVQTVSTGTSQLMIPLRNLDALKGIDVNIPAFSTYRSENEFLVCTYFAWEG